MKSDPLKMSCMLFQLQDGAAAGAQDTNYEDYSDEYR